MTAQAVILDIGSATEPHLACLNGLQAYATAHDLHWDIRLGAAPADCPRDAVVITSHPADRWAKVSTYPVGTLFGSPQATSTPCVAFDEVVFGQLAARHFHEQGYRHTCVLETDVTTRVQIIQQRTCGFREQCKELGITMMTHHHADSSKDHELVAWLKGYEHPLGIYTATDGQASWLRAQLTDSQARFPRRLAILGTGNHLRTCLARRPELSSVSFPWALIGKATAHWIHHLTQGHTVPAPQVIRPYQVVTRGSTPFAAVGDPLVDRALTWLKKHITSDRPLESVCRALQCSQPTLCRRFAKTIGISPQKMHARFRMDQATHLLEHSQLSMKVIAKRVGFHAPTTFSLAFRRHHGCSPSEWQQSVAGTT